MLSSRPSETKIDKGKSKKNSKLQSVAVTDKVKNEGENPHFAYKPPSGAQLFDHSFQNETFDWDSIKKDDDLEIWLIRVPDSIKSKNLDGLEIDAPSSSRTAQVGSLSRKGTVYDIWSMGDDDSEFAGAEELKGLSCLLPRKRKSCKLYMAPKEIAHRLVVSAQPSIATPPEHQAALHQNPSRPSYPKEILKHHFVPYGARAKSSMNPDRPSMDVDGLAEHDIISTEIEGSTHKAKEFKVKESKSRKRKVAERDTHHKKVKKPKIDE